MSEKLRERLGYLNGELHDLRQVHRSTSPHTLVSSSPGRLSRSPRPLKSTDYAPNPISSAVQTQQSQPTTPTTVTHDSRPDIVSWPAPPPASTVLSKNAQPSKGPSTTSTGTSPIPESHFHASTTLGEDSSKLLTMLRMAATSNPGVSRGREFELRRKIQNLEETVAEYERQKYNVMGSFSEYREYVAERERTLEAEYSNKIIALSEEVLGAKKDFEARMSSFQALQEQFEHEKEQALENLRQEHQKEIELLERRVAGSQLLNLEQKYIIEIRRLEDERKSLKVEKERLGETFDMKLRRAQSLYETQLSAAKTLYTKELEALRSHEEHLKEELAARHEEFRDRVQELKFQARQSREEVSACKNDITMLQKKLKQKENELEGITKELENVRAELRVSMRKLREVDVRYAKASDELDQKEAELNRRAECLEAAEGSRTKLESTVRKLQVEVKALKNKVDFLEIERENLQCQSESQTHLQNSQVQALEAVLESVTKEKETSREHYERLLEKEREQAEAREESLRRELCSKFNELEDQYNALKDYVDESGTFGPESMKILEEVEMLRAQKTNLEDEVVSLQTQLAQDKKMLLDTKNPSMNYASKVPRGVDEMRKNVHDDETTGSSSDNKIYDISVDLLRESLRKELSGSTGKPLTELESLLEKLSKVEHEMQTIIRDKNEAQSKVAKLEEDNKNMAHRLEETRNAERLDEMNKLKDKYEKTMQELENEKNKYTQLQEQLNTKNTEIMEEKVTKLQKKLDEVNNKTKQKDEELMKINNTLRASNMKSKILTEIIRYQNEPIEEELDGFIDKITAETSDVDEVELQDKIKNYEKLQKIERRPSIETRHIETSTRPEIREMALQTNIEIRQAPTQSEQLQKEIISLLTGWMDSTPDEYLDLVDLKNALLSASDAEVFEEATETSRVPQVCQKAANKIQSLMSHMAERRKSKDYDERVSRKDDNKDIRRSRSPSLLSRLRERTPSKARTNAMETSSSSTSKNFLCPSELERSADAKRKKSAKSEAGRPAWKF
ncbi:hypothetical protein M3Y94_00392500 [Aphelenchoides besseyi]|nr:hypothetical protein M3Y94_00392500 [Aphelenchoides besseyi]KAI6234986.1 hypothetical protein M3Y95_00003800 [Aphelenchoides besseyi]